MNRFIIILTAMLTCTHALDAQTGIAEPDLSVPSQIAPAYFGPNAFPVPDMSDGSLSSDLKVGLYGDGFLCRMTSDPTDDITFDIFAKATIPLFSDRVNLSVWMPVIEWFRSSPEINSLRRIENPDRMIAGTNSGDAYVSTEILLTDERTRGLGIVLRSVLKSASGNSYSTARVYDSPGYFFDLAAGRDIYKSEDAKTALRLAASTGFLCWQTGDGRQNDAVMYGISSSLKSGRFNGRVDFGGYVGWEGMGDHPISVKAKASWQIRNFSIDVMYQIGIQDWPFHQFRFGTTWSCPVLKERKAAHQMYRLLYIYPS